jgi:hypothetical protein
MAMTSSAIICLCGLVPLFAAYLMLKFGGAFLSLAEVVEYEIWFFIYFFLFEISGIVKAFLEV